MRTVRIAAALGLAGILALGAPLCAMAGTEKPESMDQETWERLQDNVLESSEQRKIFIIFLLSIRSSGSVWCFALRALTSTKTTVSPFFTIRSISYCLY